MQALRRWAVRVMGPSVQHMDGGLPQFIPGIHEMGKCLILLRSYSWETLLNSQDLRVLLEKSRCWN